MRLTALLVIRSGVSLDHARLMLTKQSANPPDVHEETLRRLRRRAIGGRRIDVRFKV